MTTPRLDRAESLAAQLLQDAALRRKPAERRQAARLARLLGDQRGRDTILALTDEVLRIDDPKRAADVMAGLTRCGRNPIEDWRAARYLGPLDRAALVAGGRLAPLLPRVVVPLARRRVTHEMRGVILAADEHRLAAHVQRRAASGIRLNVNVLGEAVLGEDEAVARTEAVDAVLRRPSVDYVSVKVSSICSQLDVLAFESEVERAADRLRRLYRTAVSTQKFVNLDMEEYRDLDLTTAVFERVLAESEFHALNAGIVLQAYLPDSLPAMSRLADYARHRRDGGGGWLKVRIVKGANLAMESVEAELHGWVRAPFDLKTETDTNYKRMLEVALDPSLQGALRVGVATHNLFDVAWAAVTAEDAGAMDRVEFEMLEGMSPAVAEAVAARFGHLLLYAPIVAPDDVQAAIAYLVRRLDENSGVDNFLAHQFAMTLGSAAWKGERDRFRRAVAALADPPPPPTRRTETTPVGTGFVNASDTDFAVGAGRDRIASHLADTVSVDWTPATAGQVRAAISAAAAGEAEWQQTSPELRRQILEATGDALEAARGHLLAVMAADAAKTVREGDPEVSEAVDFARWYARYIPQDPGFRPYGTVSVVSPFNFPLSIPAGGVLAALAAGNTVILKPAPETVAVAAALSDVLWDAGVPRSAFHFVPCDDGEASALLITDPAIDAVILTGSWDTAQQFLSWRPDLALHAETSGKNAIVVTATADPDAAIADLVHSAFGHAGQKCSAASLAILEASVYDDGRFLTRLADTVRSLRVGLPADLATVVGPLIRPPEGPLADALTRLQTGERWLVAPIQLDEAGLLWRPGVKTGVIPGSPFHMTECFGPVLGVMRASDLAHALELQNAPPYGLTAGLHALDPAEIDRWRASVHAGNLYVNRGITGAVVARQPFGGWKRSVVGPGAKAGGPNYVASLGTWPAGEPGEPEMQAAWRELATPVDFVGLVAESNVFRVRPLRRVAVMGTDGIIAARRAARIVGVELVEVGSVASAAGCDKLRILGPVSHETLAEAHASGVWVDTTPVAADARRELLRWVREQSVSESRHRHGNVTSRRPGLLPPP